MIEIQMNAGSFQKNQNTPQPSKPILISWLLQAYIYISLKIKITQEHWYGLPNYFCKFKIKTILGVHSLIPEHLPFIKNTAVVCVHSQSMLPS